jgi:uncharacterized membrane protein YwzB
MHVNGLIWDFHGLFLCVMNWAFNAFKAGSFGDKVKAARTTSLASRSRPTLFSAMA